MSERLGIDLWIKRDDLTGFAFGGNKGRKLEYLMADAMASGSDTIVTCGALQSNFIRQLGAACAMFGLRCVAAVMKLPYDAAAGRPESPRADYESGNVLLDRIMGVDLRVFPDDDWEVLYGHMDALVNEFGPRAYKIPVGGSSPWGAYAFYRAAEELAGERFDTIVHASSSGSTQVGLTYAFHGTSTRVLGICSDPEPEIVHDFAALAQGLDEVAGKGISLRAEDFELDVEHVGPGYGVPSDEGMAAIHDLARTEGIFLDPIYSGKAFAALIDLARQGELPGRTLFWHTGGTPALFVYGGKALGH